MITNKSPLWPGACAEFEHDDPRNQLAPSPLGMLLYTIARAHAEAIQARVIAESHTTPEFLEATCEPLPALSTDGSAAADPFYLIRAGQSYPTEPTTSPTGRGPWDLPTADDVPYWGRLGKDDITSYAQDEQDELDRMYGYSDDDDER